MWHQWLRHTRLHPPSLSEQQADITRQIQLKQRVKLADERWAAKASVLDRPRRGNLEVGVGDGEGLEKEKEGGWGKRERGVPGQGWQPESWTPGGGGRG